jgi:hypothetical protein
MAIYGFASTRELQIAIFLNEVYHTSDLQKATKAECMSRKV